MAGGWPGCRAQDGGAQVPSLHEPCDHEIARGGEGERAFALGNQGSVLHLWLRRMGCQVGFG